jgi:hypothetical protein
MKKDQWKQYEVVVSREGSLKLKDEKLVCEMKTGYLPLDQADCYQREQDAWNHLHNALKVFIELDKMKQYTDNGVKLKLEFSLHGMSWGWEGKRDIETRYEKTRKEYTK